MLFLELLQVAGDTTTTITRTKLVLELLKVAGTLPDRHRHEPKSISLGLQLQLVLCNGKMASSCAAPMCPQALACRTEHKPAIYSKSVGVRVSYLQNRYGGMLRNKVRI